MATYTVKEARTQKMSFQGQQDSVTVTWHKDYYVQVVGAADNTLISPYDVSSATGLPVVNQTIYSIDDKIIPYVICKSKSAVQSKKRLDWWVVSTQWKSFVRNPNQQENDNQPIDKPTALTDITPKEVPTLGEYERVLHVDYTNDNNSGPINFICDLTPAYNRWETPVVERVPTLNLKITQYEESITYEQMLERKFKVNQGTYRGQLRYEWLIEHVEATEVIVQLQAGATAAALVTYHLKHSPKVAGWREQRALVDTQYLEFDANLNKLVTKPFGAIGGKAKTGYIELNGTKRLSQDPPPDYITYETYRTIDFDSFLQI